MKEDIRRLVAQLPEDNADYAIMKIEPDYENEDCKARGNKNDGNEQRKHRTADNNGLTQGKGNKL